MQRFTFSADSRKLDNGRNNLTLNYSRPNLELSYMNLKIPEKHFSLTRNENILQKENDPPKMSSEPEFSKVNSQRIALINKNEVAELKELVKQQDATIEQLRNEVKQLRKDLDSKGELIHKQKEIINKQGSNSSLKICDDIEIGHLLPRIRLWQQVFEDKLQEYLFGTETKISKDEFLANLIEKLHIEKNVDALLLANYFIPKDCKYVNSKESFGKITTVMGKYKAYTEKDFQTLKEIFDNADQKNKAQFISRLEMLINSNIDHMDSKNFILFLHSINIDFDKRAFIVLLLRKSSSISSILVEALKEVMTEILGYKEESAKKSVNKSYSSMKSFKRNVNKIMISHKVSQAFKAQESSRPTVVQRKPSNFRKRKTQIRVLESKVKEKIDKFIKGEEANETNNRSLFGNSNGV